MKNKKIAQAGNIGIKVRSDCFVEMKILNTGGIIVDIESKVNSTYGKSIKELILDILDYFKIKNTHIKLTDKGALPWVIMARMEAVIHKLIDTNKEYLPDFIQENKYPTTRELFRFSRLYLPGNTPSMFINAGLHKPNAIILDLEDSVAPAKKHEARILIRNALRACNFYGAERMVRINQGDLGMDDINRIAHHNVHTILIPKTESAKQIKLIDNQIDIIKKKHKLRNDIYFMPIIENALGIEKVFEIAESSNNIIGLAIGLEDYTADLGVKRTKEAKESLYARSRIINACHAAKIQPIDSVFSDVGDTEGLIDSVKISRALGFEGMGCIHPRQVPIIKQGFTPNTYEIEKAKEIVSAAKIAKQKGLGVVSIGTKMIDPPVVKRHNKIIDLAIFLGLLNRNWEDNNK